MIKIGDRVELISTDDPAFTGIRKNVDGEGHDELLDSSQIWLWRGIRGTVSYVGDTQIYVIWDTKHSNPKLSLYLNKSDRFSVVPVSDTNQTIVSQSLGEIIHSILTLQKHTVWKSISNHPEIYSDLLKRYKELRGIDYYPIN